MPPGQISDGRLTWGPGVSRLIPLCSHSSPCWLLSSSCSNTSEILTDASRILEFLHKCSLRIEAWLSYFLTCLLLFITLTLGTLALASFYRNDHVIPFDVPPNVTHIHSLHAITALRAPFGVRIMAM